MLGPNTLGIDKGSLDTVESEAKSFSEQELSHSDLIDRNWLEAVLRRMADCLMLKAPGTGNAIRAITIRTRYRHMELALFGGAASSLTQRALARVVDDLRRNLGRNAIMRGPDLALRDKSS